MNTTPHSVADRKAFWLRWPFLLAAVPLVLFLVLLIALLFHERSASQQLHAELNRIREAGLPVDSVSMSQWYSEKTSREGTNDWAEIRRLVDSSSTLFGDFEKLPIVGTADLPAETPPPGQWPGESEVAEYLQWMRPVIEKTHDATEHPTPVWQPIQFQGFDTLLPELQSSREIVRLLSLETEHALYQRDADRALRGLASMRGTAEAFDEQICLVEALVQMALRSIHREKVRRSLSLSLWDEGQLQQLAQQVGPPRDIEIDWRNVIAGERAMGIASMNTPGEYFPGDPHTGIQWMFSIPSVQLQVLESYREMEAIATDDFDDLMERAKQWDALVSHRTRNQDQLVLMLAPTAVSLFQPAMHSFARAMARTEDNRRFSHTAIAIKRFQLQEGRWPDSLRELEQVGLSTNGWTTVLAGPFGYEFSGDEAYLWTYDPSDSSDFRISPDRPAPKNERGENVLDSLLTVIR